jgi:hypothetical protein
MGRFFWAIQIFFAVLFDGAKAQAVKAALAAPMVQKTDVVEKPHREKTVPKAPAPSRSEALSLLAALQREARFVDLVQQPLIDFTDEQVGAAARTVLSECQKVLDRFFGMQPLSAGPEGSPCDIPAGYDPGRYKLTGRVEGSGPFHGQLIHHGWQATMVKLPEWNGSKDSALVIAPAEVEV